MDVLTDLGKFTIGFDPRDRARLHELWDEVIDSQRWAEGPMIDRFEAAWEAEHGLPSVATASWTGGALAALAYAGVRGGRVIVPSNTFMATPLAIIEAGATPGLRRLPPRRPLPLGGRGRAAARRPRRRRARCSSCTSAATSPSTPRRIAALCRARGVEAPRGLRPRPRRHLGRPPRRRATATRASTRSTRRRRSRPARVVSWSPVTPSCWPSPARFATTASPTTRSTG